MPRNPKSIPESTAKKAKTVKALQAADAKTQKEFAALTATTQATALKNAETYAKEYAAASQKEIDLRRAAKAKGSIYVKPGAKIAFVVRIRGIIGIHRCFYRCCQRISSNSCPANRLSRAHCPHAWP